MSNTQYNQSLMLTEQNIKDCINQGDKLVFRSAMQSTQAQMAIGLYAQSNKLSGKTEIKRRTLPGGDVEWTLVWISKSNDDNDSDNDSDNDNNSNNSNNNEGE